MQWHHGVKQEEEGERNKASITSQGVAISFHSENLSFITCTWSTFLFVIFQLKTCCSTQLFHLWSPLAHPGSLKSERFFSYQ